MSFSVLAWGYTEFRFEKVAAGEYNVYISLLGANVKREAEMLRARRRAGRRPLSTGNDRYWTAKENWHAKANDRRTETALYDGNASDKADSVAVGAHRHQHADHFVL